MRSRAKRLLAGVLTCSLLIGCNGCGIDKKEPKPTPKASTKVDKGNTNASGKGDGQDDVPLVIGSTKFTKQFNPFLAENSADRQAIDLTQIDLVSNDRAGKLVYKGIDGELREYNDTNYTYYGPSDLDIYYDKEKNTTEYKIKIRNDMRFSDGEKVTIDDVIFSMYVFCDTSYQGNRELNTMPIKGLANYWANSTKAEKLSDKKVNEYIKKMPAKLKKWIKKSVIQKELRKDYENCVLAYERKGYSSAEMYFADRHNILKKGKKLTKKALLSTAEAKYSKKGYHALALKLYQNKNAFDSRIKTQARVFLAKGKGKKVSRIAGIQKIGTYEMSITTNGYCKEMSGALKMPICALHYYGDTTKYDYEHYAFGFTRGDISSVLANKSNPVGAGAYRFVKFENDVVYYTSNDLYYKGCPQVAFLQLKDMTDTLKETKKALQEKMKDQNATDVKANEEQEEADPQATVNPNADVTEIAGDTVDVLKGRYDAVEYAGIEQANSNGKLSGSTVQTQMIGDGEYHYIGIHAQNVSVATDAQSEQSVALRKALATVFSAARGILNEENNLARIVNYPVAAESWLSKTSNEEDYNVAYSQDLSGEEIYTSDDEWEDKMDAAQKAALSYFKKAGYTVEGSKVTKAPKGAALSYTVWVADGEKNAIYPVLQKATQALEKIGIALKTEAVNGRETLTRKLTSGKQQIWVASRDLTDNDVEVRYASDSSQNIFGIVDETIDTNASSLNSFMSSSARKKAYQKCFDAVLEQGVEVPVCEFREFILYSAERMNRSTIPESTTVFYSWFNEIQKITMR